MSMDLTRFSARTRGFCWSFLASSKQRDDASWPKSGFAGFSIARSVIWISGRTFFNAEAKLASHSFLKVANGFSVIFTFGLFSAVL